MGNDGAPPTINVDELQSYCDDLTGVLRDERDVNRLTHILEYSAAANSSSASVLDEVQGSIQDYQRRIHDCQQKIERVKSEVVTDEELDKLQKELQEEIGKESLLKAALRETEEKIDELDQQRLSIDERRQMLKKHESEKAKAQMKLSLYASVTNIIPSLGKDQSKISGQYVRRHKNEVLKFEFDPATTDSFEICNTIWETISND